MDSALSEAPLLGGGVNPEGLMEISLEALLEYCDPTLDDPWGCGKINPADVELQVGFAERFSSPTEDPRESETYEYNVGRIAYLLQSDWCCDGRDDEPILIDVGLRGYMPPHMICDGNHRVAAAKIRGDSTVVVSIIGDVAKAEAIFERGLHPDDYGLEP